MNLKQTSELFRRYRAEGDYASASTVMLDWAQEAGKPHNLWHANMALLLFAFNLGLYDEALLRVQELNKVDAQDPYLLEMTARICEAQGKWSEAVSYAERAVEHAEVEDPLNRTNYADYLRQLRACDSVERSDPPAPARDDLTVPAESGQVPEGVPRGV